ncbi:MAG TPA: hypothetical protein VMU68_10225 [Acidimicrobiales bacterium]|nr:hypothetical protein [Acidimicrobiales bacterium]
MSASRNNRARPIRRTLASATFVTITLGFVVLPYSAASASGRSTFTATTSANTGVVMLALVGGLLVLVGIGSVAFTLARRKKRPIPCADQREALALAEKAVQYWEAVRAHVVTVETERLSGDGAESDDATHATQLAKAVEGLSAAMKQRDQCEMDLIHCMASGVRLAAIAPPQNHPFFIPGTDGTSTENSPHAD